VSDSLVDLSAQRRCRFSSRPPPFPVPHRAIVRPLMRLALRSADRARPVGGRGGRRSVDFVHPAFRTRTRLVEFTSRTHTHKHTQTPTQKCGEPETNLPDSWQSCWMVKPRSMLSTATSNSLVVHHRPTTEPAMASTPPPPAPTILHAPVYGSFSLASDSPVAVVSPASCTNSSQRP
jgi:hypothetical protein